MNDYDLQIRLLDGASRFTGMGLNWVVQSSLLLGMGLLVGRLLRRRGPAAQSAVYRTTLVAAFVCPVVGWALARVGISGWSVDLPPAWTLVDASAAPASTRDKPMHAVPAADDSVAARAGRPFKLRAADELAEIESPADARGPGVADRATFRATPVPATPSPDVQARPRRASATAGPSHGARTLVVHPFGLIASAVCLIWLVWTTVLLVRLAGAWRQLARLCKSAADTEPATVALCQEIAALLRVAAPDVKHSPYLPGPCLAGLLRPVVLLPEGPLGIAVRDVLLHELAHLVRRDGHWNLLCRLATAVFPVQPLLSELARRLETTAEEACDDYVVQYGSDRQAYAHRLVDIAELFSASLLAVGVVSLRSLLAHRVARILDTSRSPSLRVGRRLLTLVLLGGLAGLVGVGLVGIGQRPFAAEPDAAARRSEDRAAEAGAQGAAETAGERGKRGARGQNEDLKELAGEPERKASAEIRGRVVGANGKPLAGAHVAAIGGKLRVGRGGEEVPLSELLGEATTDEQGNCRLKLTGVSSKTHCEAHVIATADGAGLAWQRLAPDVSLTLPTEQVIRGRVVDREGRPAPGVRLSILWVVTTTKNERAPEGVCFEDFQHPPAAWPQPVRTDELGRFVIHHVAADQGVLLRVEGTDRFALQEWAINTGLPKESPAHDDTYRPQVRNCGPGEEAVLQLLPAQIFEGVVRYADTGEPAPRARLILHSSQHGGSWMTTVGTADAQGRYRLNPYPGRQFRLTAYPPDGAPYLIRQVGPIAWAEGAAQKQVNMILPRGILVRGRVVEAGTNAAVAGATIQYVPEDANNPYTADGIVTGFLQWLGRALSAPNPPTDDEIVTGWQGIQLSAEDGRFEITVLPGPGRLLAHGPFGEFVLQEIGSRQLHQGRPGGGRHYAHAILRVNPEPKSGPIPVTLELQRGARVAIRLFRENGEPVDEALLITRLNVDPSSLTWRRGPPQQAFGGRLELSGLAEGQEYPVHFLDAEHRLGATAILKASAEVRTIVLTPCGQATAKFVDARGRPRAGIEPTIEMVVTAGAPSYAPDALLRDELLDDADSVGHIDATNYWPRPKTDDEGRITFPALIPGGTYRLLTAREGKLAFAKEFTVKPRETMELGEIVFSGDK